MADRTRRELLGSFAVAGAVGLAGCGGSENTTATSSPSNGNDSEVPSVSERWVSATPVPVSSLLPHRIADEASSRRLELVMDGAYTISENGEMFPLWLDISSREGDNRVYEATLREGLYWSDPYGRMTADDWVYYIRNVHQGPDNWAGSQFAGLWAGVGVERTGERTFEITLPEPNARFPFSPALREARCLPRELIEPYVRNRDREGLETDAAITGLAYTGNLGPYTAETWAPGERFVAARNGNYYMRGRDDVPKLWANAPYFEAFEYRVIGREYNRLQALRDGSATTTTVPPTRLDQFRGDESINLYGIPQPRVTLLAYNQRANGWEPFRTPAVRRAFSMAINKNRLAEAVYDGFAEPIHTFQPPWSYWDGADLTAFGRGATGEDPMVLLVNALGGEYGVANRRIVDGDGQPVTLTLVYPNDSNRTPALVSFIVNNLERAGLTIETEGVPIERLYTEYLQTQWQGENPPPWTAGQYNAGPRENSASATDWDLLCGVGFNAYPRAPTATDRFWRERGDMNFAGYIPTAQLTALYARARAASNERQRQNRLTAVFEALNRDQPANFLVAHTTPIGYREEIVGPHEILDQDWDRQTWYAE